MLPNLVVGVIFFGVIAAVFAYMRREKQMRDAYTRGAIEGREMAEEIIHVVYKGYEIPLRRYEAAMWGKMPDKDKNMVLDAQLNAMKHGIAFTEEGEYPNSRRIVYVPNDTPQAISG